MLKDELKKLEKLARKNALKAEKEIAEMEKKGLSNKNEKKLEKYKVDETLESYEATKLFKEMKEREF